MTLRVLMNKYNLSSNALSKVLPEEDVKSVLEYPITSKEIEPLLRTPLEQMNRIHYSWLQPAIESLPKELQGATIAAFPEPKRSRLLHLMDWKLEVPNLSPPVKEFLIANLFKGIRKRTLVPLEYCPSSPLDVLKNFSKEQITELFDYLAILDLAHEVKHIVDKKIWIALQKCLSPAHRRFLVTSMKQKKTVSPPKPLLLGWMGDCSQLNKILQMRGIQRLAYALSGENSSFVWHIARRLDSGRGKMLLNYYSKKAHPKITPVMQEEMLNVLNYINETSTVK